MKTNDFSQLGALMNISGGEQRVAKPEPPESETVNSKKKPDHKRPEKQNTGRERPLSRSTQEPSKNGRPEAFVLRRAIKVYCWNVKATISKASKRHDLIPVLMRAQENNGTYGRDIADHLLGEEIGREVVGIRLLAICESLGLLKNQGEKNRPRYFLTEEGTRALDSGSVMVPEENTWTIWASDDPLLNYPILCVESFHEGSALNEVFNNKKREAEDRNDKFENVPSWLRDACSKAAIPAAIGTELIRLDGIDQRVEPVAANSKLTLEWMPEVNFLKIRGSINKISVDATPKAPAVTFNDIWQELLENEQLWPQWDVSKERLLVSFDSKKSADHSSMQRRLEFVEPNLQELGPFESAHQVVTIFPQSLEDAQQWAEWKLRNQNNTYATEAEFARWCQKALQPFEEYSDTIELPTCDELAINAWENRYDQQNTSTIWHLMAVKDWGV